MKTCVECDTPILPSAEECPQCGVFVNGGSDGLVGQTLADKYLIEERLAIGGMCSVYRARHTLIGKEVAIKILKPTFAADPKLAERFEQEARASSLINHPHAVNVTDFGVAEDKLHFIVMELLDGEPISRVVQRQGPLPIKRVAHILRQVCSALDAAHAAGVIHRDIKADNIILSDYEGADWVTVVDFGISKILEDIKHPASMTGANLILGTPRYMAPEQCQGNPVDARTDVYSLGVVLYEMLTGKAPFEDASATRLLLHHTSTPAPPLRRRRPDLLPEVEAVVMRALEKNPEERPQSAMELLAEFEHAARLDEAARTDPELSNGRIRIPLPEADESLRQAWSKADATVGLDQDKTRVRTRSPFATKVTGRSDVSYETVPAMNSVPVTTRRRSTWRSSRIALVALAVVLVGTALFLLFNNSPSADEVVGDPIVSAQVAVNDAIRQVQLLPREHKLQETLPRLSEWQGMLRVYGQLDEPTAQMKSEAATIRQQAAEIAQQAHQIVAQRNGEASPDSEATDTPGAVPANPANEVANRAAQNMTNTGQEVVDTLNGWAAALNRQDLPGYMNYYADKLKIYYRKRNVSRERVASDRAEAFEKYSSMNVNLGNLAIGLEPSGEKAVVTLDKTWSFHGDRPSGGAVQSRVWLEKRDGRWVITGERDLKVYSRRR